MASGALLFSQDPSVSLVVVVVVVVMLYATLRSISQSRTRAGDEEQRTDAQPYLSSSSDPYGYQVRGAIAHAEPAPVTATPAHAEEAGPVDMTLYDPDAYD